MSDQLGTCDAGHVNGHPLTMRCVAWRPLAPAPSPAGREQGARELFTECVTPAGFISVWHKYQAGIQRTAEEYLYAALEAYAALQVEQATRELKQQLTEIADAIGYDHSVLSAPCSVIAHVVKGLADNAKRYFDEWTGAEQRLAERGRQYQAMSQSEFEKRNEVLALRTEVQELKEALGRRQTKGHHDTCSSMLIDGYDCDCGFADAMRLLFKEPKA